MEVGLAREIFFVLLAALSGGVLVKFLKLQPIVGYILAGIVFSFFSVKIDSAGKLAEIGAILLLFSVGIEVSLDKLSRVAKVAVIGGILQIIISTSLVFLLLGAFGIGGTVGAILAFGFSLSSTAMVVKILTDKGEENTLHGEIMIGWLLVQDLAVIPLMVVLPSLAIFPGSILASIGLALIKAAVVVGGTFILGKLIAPYFIHKIAAINSRELLVLSSMTLALGTAFLTSYFGVSPALGAFLAGVVISESQENHAVFSETRPLRDLFVALFFVSLGFLVAPGVIVAKIGLIVLLALVVVVIKLLVVFILAALFGYHGKTAIAVAFGLSQIGEFAFIIFSLALGLGLVSAEVASIGIATTLLTLIVTPFLFKSITPVWNMGKGSGKLFAGWGKSELKKQDYSGHIIICGYGRVGGWVGKALTSAKIPFVVVDYNQTVINELKKQGIEAIYGDPTETEVIAAAGLKGAKAVVLAIPDEVAQEAIVAHIQSVAPGTKIISRVHKDEAWEKLKVLKVDKLVQPEFEAAITIIRTILVSSGKGKAEINDRTKSLRLSRAMS